MRAAWDESRIKALFEDECILILSNGKRIPFYQLDNTYALPRWTHKADAEAARAILTSPDRNVPRGSSSTHDDWILAALRQEKVMAYDAVQEFMRDSYNEIHAIQHHPSGHTSHEADERIRLLHHRFGHLAPQAMEKLPKAIQGVDELRGFTREQIEKAVGGACDICAQSRMLRQAHRKSINKKYSITDPLKGLGTACLLTTRGR